MRDRASVRGVIVDDDNRVLLVKWRRQQDGASFWLCPGGGREKGEDDAGCLAREIAEETGLAKFDPGPHVATWRWVDGYEHRFYTEAMGFPLVKVEAASLSGGGYLGTEYPMMLRLRYRDAAGNGQTWYRGFYYQNAEGRPTSRGEVVPQGAWTRVQVDLADLPERPAFLYSLEVLGAGHDFDALITDIRLVAE